MTIDIKLVHFRVPDDVQKNIKSKISHCLDRYSITETSTKIFLTRSSQQYYVKVYVNTSNGLHLCVHALHETMPLAFDKAIKKFSETLRRAVKRMSDRHYKRTRKDKSVTWSEVKFRENKKYEKVYINPFDTFENQYIDEFDENMQVKKVG
jgi:ribosomal subunit interface protein